VQFDRFLLHVHFDPGVWGGGGSLVGGVPLAVPLGTATVTHYRLRGGTCFFWVSKNRPPPRRSPLFVTCALRARNFLKITLGKSSFLARIARGSCPMGRFLHPQTMGQIRQFCRFGVSNPGLHGTFCALNRQRGAVRVTICTYLCICMHLYV
jgi:hypothetical protein